MKGVTQTGGVFRVLRFPPGLKAISNLIFTKKKRIQYYIFRFKIELLNVTGELKLT